MEEKQTNHDSIKPSFSKVYLFTGIMLLLWIAAMLGSYKLQIKDLFDALNALFAGAAFISLITTISVQLHQISLMKQDIKQSSDDQDQIKKSLQELADSTAKYKKISNIQIRLSILSQQKSEIKPDMINYKNIMNEYERKREKGVPAYLEIKSKFDRLSQEQASIDLEMCTLRDELLKID